MKLTDEQKAANKVARKIKRDHDKAQAVIQAEINQKPVKEMTISIEWKKSATWGQNPHLTAEITYIDGTHERSEVFKYSGCGYDKESTVMAMLFNAHLKYALHILAPLKPNPIPYGIYLQDDWKRYGDGIGMNCYYKIADFIMFHLEHIGGGKSFDLYKLTNIGGLTKVN